VQECGIDSKVALEEIMKHKDRVAVLVDCRCASLGVVQFEGDIAAKLFALFDTRQR
jgi:hypothetical protein